MKVCALFVALLFAAASGGCSWLLGVSEDPVVVDLSEIPDAADAADAAQTADAAETGEPDAPVE